MKLTILIIMLWGLTLLIAHISDYKGRMATYNQHMMCDVYGRKEYCK